jgi:hypothetical protein
MICQKCGNEVRSHERNCPVCDADVGYPNVRAAETQEEVSALQERAAVAVDSCAARGCSRVLLEFQRALQSSKPVLSRSIQQVMALMSSDNELYASFYAQVGAHSRRPEETLVERERLIADNLLFPYFHEEIRFAALSLDGKGVRHYGACALALSEVAIRTRASVFEKNSVEFCREHKLSAGKSIPPGHRAVWQDRDKLAVAKLHDRLSADLKSDRFGQILLDDESNPDFIEVHIYGQLHRRAIESIFVHESTDRSAEALILEIERRAEELNAKVMRESNT